MEPTKHQHNTKRQQTQEQTKQQDQEANQPVDEQLPSTPPTNNPPTQDTPSKSSSQHARIATTTLTTPQMHKQKDCGKEGDKKPKAPKVYMAFQPQGDPNTTSKVIFDPTNVTDGEMVELYHEVTKENIMR